MRTSAAGEAELPWSRVLRRAETQWGVVSRPQLIEAGLVDAAIDRLIQRGVLHREYRGIYSLGHRRLETTGALTAAILRAGPGSMLGGPLALWWWQVLAVRPSRTHLLSPHRVGAVEGLVVRKVAGVKPTEHRGLPVCPIERALIDSVTSTSLNRIRRCISEALYRRLTTVEAIEAELQRGLTGSAVMREALERHRRSTQRTRSELEEAFLVICERERLPRPRVNCRIAGCEVDVFWPEVNLVVEIDGPGHAEIARQQDDRVRELRIRAAGVDVIRYGYVQVRNTASSVGADVRREYRRRQWEKASR